MSGYDLSDCPDLTPYAADYRPDIAARGVEVLRDDLLGTVTEAIAAKPRNLQKELGPSQLGVPCNRWLAYKLADVPHVGLRPPMWRAAVGTAVHADFSDWLHRYNEVHGFRWLTDLRVWVGDLYAGRPITGSFDAFDTWTQTVVDLKVSSKSAMDKARRTPSNGPQYDVQIDSYGVGAINAGLPVRNVGILRLPASGELSDAVFNVRPHEPERAKRALIRVGAIARLVDTVGPQAAAMQPATEHYCGTCEWFRPGSTDLTTGCPGAESFVASRERRNQSSTDSLTSLIA